MKPPAGIFITNGIIKNISFNWKLLIIYFQIQKYCQNTKLLYIIGYIGYELEYYLIGDYFIQCMSYVVHIYSYMYVMFLELMVLFI